MDAEIQRRRTFEIIAKWIGMHNGVTIQFQPDAVPNADVKARVITLPSNMKIENLDKVLALVFHEAGHIRHSTFDVKKIVTNQAEKDTLNGCEDARVDGLMMGLLPRIKDFYQELVKWEDETYPPDTRNKKITPQIRAFLESIRRYNDLSKGEEPNIEKFMRDERLVNRMHAINGYLDACESYNDKSSYNEVKKQVKELTEIIFGKQKNQKQDPNGQGEGEGEGDPEEGEGESNGEGEEGNPKGGNNQAGNAGEKKPNATGKKPGGRGFQGHAELFVTDPNAHYALDDLSLTEQTLQAFNELLTVKSIRVIPDGQILNTDNLTSYFTGDVEGLFKDIKIVKYKKSKIMFLLDSSGSMQGTDGMCDNQYKTKTLINVCRSLTKILKELQEVEGINVDFQVRGFDDCYHVWDNDVWEQEYARCPGGGTDCEMAFRKAQDEILNDKTIDGNKMVVLITDGQIGGSQISGIKDMIMRNSSDVKCMILGIGTNEHFTQELGGRNIIAKELADGEILGAIEDMLE